MNRDVVRLDPDWDRLYALDIQGVLRAAYIQGNVEGINRVRGKGGDLLTFNGETWLVVVVLETWDTPGWCKVAINLQTAAP